MITLTINRTEVTVPQNLTILEAATSAGIYIPTLCQHSRMTPIGSCRMCMVEIEGCSKPMAACTTFVKEGISVTTHSERLDQIRRDSLKLMLVNHPLDCPVCDKGGECALQNLVYEFGIDEVEYRAARKGLQSEYATPLIHHWPDRCIMCLRCVTACREITGVSAIDLEGNGYDSRIVPVRAESCESCGECLAACPVGALTENVSRYKGRPWLINRTITTCPFCSCGCRFELNVMNNRVLRVTAPSGTGSGSLCVKGRFGYEVIGSDQRLTQPLVKSGGSLQEASWATALERVVQGLQGVKEKEGPDALGGICSDRLTNEEAYLFQKLMRAALGTNNVDHAGGFSYSGVVKGLQGSLGQAAGGLTLDAIRQADTIFVLRSDVSQTHPVAGHQINLAVKRDEAQLVVASDRALKQDSLATVLLSHKPCTEISLINGLIKALIDEKLYDETAVSALSQGFDQMKLASDRSDGDYGEQVTGVAGETVKEAARLLARGKRVCVLVSTGLGIPSDDEDLAHAVANLALLIGIIGREGSGVAFLGEKCNSQGVLDMGVLPLYLPGLQDISDQAVRAAFEEAWGSSLPGKPGQGALEMLRGAEQGTIKALYLVGENPVVTYPDRNQTERALGSLEFLVVQDQFLTPTAMMADVVLPVASFAEKGGTYTNFERRVQKLTPGIKQMEGVRTDLALFNELSRLMGYDLHADSPDQVMQEIRQLVPLYEPADYKVLDTDGVRLRTEFTKGKFLPVADDGRIPARSGSYPLVLLTGSVLFHSGSYSTKSPALNLVGPGNWVALNPEDASDYQLSDGQEVLVKSERGEIRVTVRISTRQMKGTVFVPCHFAGQSVNTLTSKDLEPTYVTLEKA